jgi:hypothetical protein
MAREIEFSLYNPSVRKFRVPPKEDWPLRKIWEVRSDGDWCSNVRLRNVLAALVSVAWLS